MRKNKLLAQAALLKTIRDFFEARDVLEVQTPLLLNEGATDPFLHSFETEFISEDHSEHERLYLQTSPEHAMKALLADGSGSIYQVCKAFRNGERGPVHHPEFTMLEWYRLDFDHHTLMDEVDHLIQTVLSTESADRITYADLFLKHLALDPHCAPLETLYNTLGRDVGDRDTCLQLLMADHIEPTLGHERPVFVYDYPEGQAALARLRARNDSPPVAERFELYVNGIELANGFHELSNPAEQSQRCLNDNQTRERLGLTVMPLPETLISALQTGLPDCAGVALGIDRLLMLQAQ